MQLLASPTTSAICSRSLAESDPVDSDWLKPRYALAAAGELAIVAMIFGIAKGFGFEKKLEEMLIEKMSGQEEMLREVLDMANSLLAETQGGIIAGIGVALLFWSVMKVLGNIESSFNAIWEIKRARPMIRKFTDALTAHDADSAGVALRQAFHEIDRVAAKGTLHKNTAARRKSQLQKKMNALTAQ